MINVDSVWQISLISLFAGVMIGALGYRLLSPSVKRIDEVESDRDKAIEEMANYKANVNQHFNKTSELVNDLTQNYVKVYQHLADGAQSLGDIGTLNNLLEQGQGKVSIAVNDEVKVENSVVDVSPVEASAMPESAQTVEETVDVSIDSEIDETAPKDFVDESAATKKVESKDEIIIPAKTSEPVADAKTADADSASTSNDSAAEEKKTENSSVDTAEEKKTEDKSSGSQGSDKKN